MKRQRNASRFNSRKFISLQTSQRGVSGIRQLPFLLYSRVALVVLVAILASCAASVPFIGKTSKLDLNFVAASDLNPDGSGRASPVVLRIYELKSKLSFDNAEFFVIYDNDKEILGSDILAVEERQVFPGEQFKIERKLNEETRAIGILAAYRNIDASRWRATIDSKPGKNIKGSINVGANALSYLPK